MALNFDELNKALSAVLTLISLGGQFAAYGIEIYAHIKEQGGLTDEQIQANRDLTLDENERVILANLAAEGATPTV